jgi:LPXTG-motif cell wall-anchored protein
MTPDAGRVTRADLEAKLREVRGEIEETGEAAKGTALIVAGVAAAALLGLVFLLGKRRGRRKSTVVEIRRV